MAMSVPRKSLRTIKTMAGITDIKRSRTPTGAFLELAGLATEKERLNMELAAAHRRSLEIQTRLAEISAKQERLSVFIKDPEFVAAIQSSSSAESTMAGIRSKVFDY